MRHQILIVDDENVERNGIKFLLKQMGFALELREASNGKEALEYLLANPEDIDIIFTDIKMPFVDGIQLIKEVREKCTRDYKIIIFSGYSEFEYAQFAMKMGVQDYILKPVDPAEFERTIRKVISELEEQELMKSMQEESISFMKEHMLYSLVNGAPITELNPRASKFMDIGFLQEYGRMCLFEFDTDFFGRSNGEFKDELLQVLGVPFQYLNLNLQQSLLLFPKGLAVDYKMMGKMIFEFFRQRYSLICHVAISSEWEEGAAGIASHFEEVESLMENKFYQSDGNVFLAKEEGITSEAMQNDDDTCMKQIQQDIKMKDMKRLRMHLDTFKLKYKGNNQVSQVYIKFIFSNLLKTIYDHLPNEDNNQMKQSIDRLYRATDIGKVIELIEENVLRLEKEFNSNSLVLHKEIESIKQMIYENYDKELSVEQLAEKVYMAPSYLSHVFKKETGQNLSKFIKAYRMEKAKEMLENTHKKIVNISYDVGYSNVSYFCQSFREYFGISPQKFRNQGVADEAEI